MAVCASASPQYAVYPGSYRVLASAPHPAPHAAPAPGAISPASLAIAKAVHQPAEVTIRGQLGGAERLRYLNNILK